MDKIESKAKAFADIVGWWVSRLTFTAVTLLTCLGANQIYAWWQTTQPVQFDITQLSDEERSELSKEIFLYNQDRKLAKN